MRSLFKTYRSAYSNHPREIWVLALLSLINRMGTMVLPFLTLYFSTVLDFSPSDTGYLISALGVGMFAGSYFGGKLCKVLGSKTVMIMSLVTGGIFLILIQFYTNFYPLLLLMFLTAAFGDAYRPAMMVSAGNFVKQKEMGRTMSLLRLMINIGMALGPALGGYLAVTLGYSWLFWIDGLTCIGAAIFLGYASKNWQSDVQQKNEEVQDSVASENKIRFKVYRDKKYMLFLMSTFLMAFAFMQMFHTVPYFLKTEWFFGELHYGRLLGFSCLLVVLIEMPLVHNVEAKNRIKSSSMLGLLCIGFSYLLFFSSASLWICYAMVTVWTLGEILNLPFNSAEAMNYGPEKHRGDYMSYFWMTWSLATILAPIVGLNFVDQFGFNPFWILLLTLSLCSLFLFRLVWKRH